MFSSLLLRLRRERQALPSAELRLGRDLLTTVCAVTIGAVLFVAVLMVWAGLQHATRLVGQALIVAIAALSLALVRSGKLEAAARLLAWGMLFNISYFAAISTHGHLAPITLGYLVIVAAAAWFLGRTSTMALALASVAALAGLAGAEAVGWLPSPAPTTPLFQWITQASIFVVGALLVVAASRAMAIRLQELDQARQDLTHALAETTKREAQLRLIADSVPAMIAYCDRELTVRWANDAYAKFMGFTPREIVGRPLREVMGETVFEATRSQIERTLQGEPVHFESSRPGANGDWRVLEAELVPDRADDGGVRGWFGMLRDVTERRRWARLLPSLARGTARATGGVFLTSLVEQIGAALEVAHVLLAATDSACREARVLARWSTAGALELTTWPLEGAPCNEVIRLGAASFESDVTKRFPGAQGLARSAIEGYYGIALRGEDGEPIGLLVVMDSKPLRLNEEQIAALGIFANRVAAELERLRLEDCLREANLSLERRVAERTAQLSEANRELEAFSFSVSHDLRAPLRHIGGYARLLAEDEGIALDQRGREFLARILKSVSRLDELIGDLLELSQVGRQQTRRGPVDLAELAKEIAEELSHAEPERKVDWRIAGGLLVDADERMVRGLLNNLIGNSWKYTARSAQATIEVGRGGDGAFFVRDNGVGFDLRHAERLFQPFQRFHRSSEFEGTGIGLAIAAKVVARHGGSIRADSAPGEGATFHFTLAPTSGVIAAASQAATAR